jgi:transcriptional regulator with XRE-family HTH domain
MADRAERARWMLNFPGVLKKEAAAAMGVGASAVSRLLRSERKISEEEFDRLQSYFRSFRGDGFEEPFEPEVTPAPSLSPIYPARAVSDGDWVVDLAAAPEQRLLAPAPFRGTPEAYGFRAPDKAAWPRYKQGEIVWVSPTAPVLSGDDVFVSENGARSRINKGRIAEYRRGPDAPATIVDYGTRALREIDRDAVVMQKIAPRDL